MYPEREEDVTNEQLARLVWTPERGNTAIPRLAIVVSSVATGSWFRSPIRGASVSSAIASNVLRGK